MKRRIGKFSLIVMELESNIVHTLSPNIDSIRVVAATNHHKFSTLEIGGAPCGKVIHPTLSYIKAFISPSSVSFGINIDINMNRLLSKPPPPPSSVSFVNNINVNNNINRLLSKPLPPPSSVLFANINSNSNRLLTAKTDQHRISDE